MSGKVFLGMLSRCDVIRTQRSFNFWGQLGGASYCTARKVEFTKFEKMDKILSFDDFKNKYIESLDSFKAYPAINMICGNDLEKISKAYERFCLSQYAAYKHEIYGGNPSLMI